MKRQDIRGKKEIETTGTKGIRSSEMATKGEAVQLSDNDILHLLDLLGVALAHDDGLARGHLPGGAVLVADCAGLDNGPAPRLVRGPFLLTLLLARLVGLLRSLLLRCVGLAVMRCKRVQEWNR